MPIRSLYIWNGERGADENAERSASRRIARLEAIHSYDTPAISGWHCDEASPSMRDWLAGI